MIFIQHTLTMQVKSLSIASYRSLQTDHDLLQYTDHIFFTFDGFFFRLQGDFTRYTQDVQAPYEKLNIIGEYVLYYDQIDVPTTWLILNHYETDTIITLMKDTTQNVITYLDTVRSISTPQMTDLLKRVVNYVP